MKRKNVDVFSEKRTKLRAEESESENEILTLKTKDTPRTSKLYNQNNMKEVELEKDDEAQSR